MIKFVKNILVLFLIFLFLPSCTSFKAMKLLNSGKAVSNTNLESVVQFTLKDHPILIKAKLNNSPREYTLILDTGALNMIRKEVAIELGIPKGIEVKAGGSDGHSKTIELIQLDRVIVGNMQVSDIATGVTDFSELFSSNIAGVLGSNFFKHFKVIIDYQENKVTLSQDTKPVKLKDNEIRIPFESDMKNGFAPKIECVVDGKINGTGIIDTGANGIADLPLAMMKKTSSFEEGAVLTAKGSMSAGMFGVEDESLAIRVKEILIGDLRLTSIPSMSHAAKNGHVLIGNNFLNKFLVTLNYPADEMILKPNGVPFETNIPSYGLALTKKDKKTLISGVVKNSSAAQKGMVPGYEIVKINSREVRTISLMEILSIFSNEDINSIEIEFIKEKLLKKVTLHKEMLFPINNKI